MEPVQVDHVFMEAIGAFDCVLPVGNLIGEICPTVTCHCEEKAQFEELHVGVPEGSHGPNRGPSDPLSEGDTKENLVDYICKVSAAYRDYGPTGGGALPPLPGYGEHAEVGDDHISYTNSVVQFLGELVVSQELLGIRISKKDTFVSERYANYSETYMLKPENRGEAYMGPELLVGRDIPYLDTVKLRLLLPVSNQRQKHSDTVEGKVGLLAKSTTYATPLMKGDLELGSLIQCVSMDMMREIKFPFLPDYLGGLGAIPVCDEPARWFARAAAQYRQGRYQSLIYTVTESVRLCTQVQSKEHFRFLTKINQATQQWRTWYNFYSRYVPSVSGSVDIKHIDKQVGQFGEDPLWDSAADRLVGLGALVTEASVLVHQRNAELTQGLLGDISFPEFQERLKAEKDSQKALTIYSRAFRDVWQSPVILGNLPPPTMEGVDVTLSLTSGGSRSFKNQFKHGFLYHASVIDQIYSDGPLKVPLGLEVSGLPTPLYFTRVLDEDMRDHVEELLSWATNPQGVPPAYLLEDDPILVIRAIDFSNDANRLVGRVPTLFVRTADVRLCDLINRRTAIPVVMVYPTTTDEEVQEIIEDNLVLHPELMYEFLDDTGSVRVTGQLQMPRDRTMRVVPGMRSSFGIFPRRLRQETVTTPRTRLIDRFNRWPRQAPARRGPLANRTGTLRTVSRALTRPFKWARSKKA